MARNKTSQFIYYLIVYGTLCTMLIGLFYYSLTLGAVKTSLNDATNCLFSHDTSSTVCNIIINNRLTRTIAGIISGSALALAGAVLFYITRNPLACPSLLGMNQGAVLGTILALIIIPSISIPGTIIFTLCGGLLAGLIVYFLVSIIGNSMLKLVLVGQAINIFLYALAQILIILFPHKTGGMLVTLNGSLANNSWQKINLIAPEIVILIIITIILAKKIYLLSLGRETALSIGINTKKLLIIIFGLIIGLCSLSVALVGQLLFFPLITVHINKAILNIRSPYHFCITNCLIGAILMLGADCIMRLIYTDQEISLGIFMAIIGVPVLIISSRLRYVTI